MIVLDRGALGPSFQLDAGRLALVTPGPVTRPEQRVDCAWDERVQLRPGAVNAHTHLYSGLAPLGLPAPARPPENFVQILERIWWRLDRALDEKSLRASVRYAIADALLSGTTTLVDHHESPRFIEGSLDVIADEAQALGIRLAVGYGATERNGGAEEAQRGLAECRRFLDANRRSLVRGMVALHASFTVSDETIRAAGELAWSLTAPMHVHVAEDVADVEDARRRGYEGPLERLLHLEALPPGSVVAHGVHLDAAEVERADGAGVWLVQNPRSNEGNRVGYPHSLRASAHVALGTDGWPAKMDDEAAALRRLGRAHGDDEKALEARLGAGQGLASALFKMSLGEVKPGFVADVVAGVPGEPPRQVLVNGRRVVADGRLVTGDLEEIRAKAKEAAPELWRRMEAFP
ncbi:MAG: amidohydrolase family protein [Myxococcaceae bacterium]|nr:amidohydrolase family protein [Myxococcaceae bacterium]